MIQSSCGCSSGGKPKVKKIPEVPKSRKAPVLKESTNSQTKKVNQSAKKNTNNYKDLDKKTSILFIKSSKCGYCQDFDKKYWSEWSKIYNENINIVSFDPMKVKYRDPFLEEILKVTFAVPSIYFIKYRENGVPLVKSIDYTNHKSIKQILEKKH